MPRFPFDTVVYTFKTKGLSMKGQQTSLGYLELLFHFLRNKWYLCLELCACVGQVVYATWNSSSEPGGVALPEMRQAEWQPSGAI